MTTEKNKEDFLIKEIESWKGFEYALREENRILFHEMLNECQKYGDAAIAKGDNCSTESLFMALILQQQKMINQLINKLSRSQRVCDKETYLLSLHLLSLSINPYYIN